MSKAVKLLVVDDDPLMLDFVSLALTSLGYSPVTSTDGASVMDLLEQDPDIRALIIDMRLGTGPNGAELALEALAFRQDLKVVLTSGDPGSLQIASRTLPHDVVLLPKPYRRRDLATRLSNLL